MRTLHLTIKPKSFSTNIQTICEGETYLGHSTSGTYIDTLIAANGCDSIRTLHLTIKSKSSSTINQTICEGESYLGHNSSGTYIDTLITANGCDSMRTLHLTIKRKSFSTVNQTICEGETYLGHNTSGIYIDTVIAANGCDSIRTLHLTVTDKPKPNLGANTKICKGDTLMLFPGSFSTYIWQDGSTQDHFVVKEAGLYSVTVSNNCGSQESKILITENYAMCFFQMLLLRIKMGKMMFLK